MRDPRTDPIEGDLICNARGDVFRVMSSSPQTVVYTLRPHDRGDFYNSHFKAKLSDWEAEHRRATIIHVAEGVEQCLM